MLNPIYIKSILEQNQFVVDYLNGINTGAIQIHRFKVKINRKSDVVTVKRAKVHGNRVFIELEKGMNTFGEELTRKLEETVMFAVSMTPENRLPYLLNPMYFVSDNFSDLMEFDLNEHVLEQDFNGAMEPMQEKKSDILSFHGMSFPVNMHTEQIKALFEKVESFHSFKVTDSKVFVRFNTFCDNQTAEYAVIKQVRGALNEIGIFTEITDILAA